MTMPDPMDWPEVDSMRCKCVGSELEEVPDLPNCLRCKTCGGWYALSISCLSENLTKVRAAFAGKDTDEPT